jgi:hypothetical protein
MSTSDPNRPGGPDEASSADDADTSIEQTTPAADDAPAHEVAPTVETLDPPASTEPIEAADDAAPVEPVDDAAPLDEPEPEPAPVVEPEPIAETVEPVAVEPPPTTGTLPIGTPVEPAPDTGRHAVVRPTPVPPDEPAPDPVVTATPVAPVAPVEPVVPVAAYGAGAETPDAAAPVAPPAEPTEERLFPDPNAPRTTSVGSHILGVLVGLILAPIGVGVLMLGESRILAAQVGGWDASTEVLGIVLVSLGLLVLGCVLLLALWTPAVPITGGTILTLAGIVYLYIPSIAREQTLNILTSQGWRLTVTQVTVAGTSGMVLAVGFLLLLAGLVAASARRRGVHLGEFRERHRV